MKITNTVKKFQFFDEQKDSDNKESLLKNRYTLKDITPNQMESNKNIQFISGFTSSKKEKEDTLEPENSLFKIYKNKVVDEHKLFSKKICKFKLLSVLDKCYLLAIGYDQPNDSKKSSSPISLLKVYDCSSITEAPKLIKEITINEGTSNPQRLMTCFAVNTTLSYAAVGFNEGSVLVIISKNLLDDSTKVMKYLAGDIEKDKTEITNMAYGMVSQEQMLFITSVKQIFFYNVDERSEEGTSLPEAGIMPQCFDLCEAKNYFAVVNELKIAFYVNLDQGPSWFFEGKKKCCFCFKDYIVFVSYEDKVSTLQIFDPNNKFFALYQNSFDKILQVAIDGELIYVLYEDESGRDKVIKVLKEKENKEKFETFYKKSFYDTAYEYAKNLNYDQRTLSEISKRYAQFLYDKGDYRKSIEQYIKTINYLDPAFVIQPFVDGSKLEYLIDYLEAIQKDKDMKRNCPPDEMNDYSALLLNCYIKKKQLRKLKEFVEEIKDDKIGIDINTAIDICKESNQSDIALSLAERSQLTNSSIQILIDMKKDYKGALMLLSQEKDITKKLQMFLRSGEVFIEKCPAETIAYIQSVIQEIIDIKKGENEAKKKSIANIKYDSLIQVFMKNEIELEKILDFIMANDPNCPASVIHRRIEIYADQKKTQKIKELLQNKDFNSKVDVNYLLMLFTTQDLKNELLVDICEKMELKQELIIQYMDKRNYPQIIECLKKYGKDDVNIWIQALTYFINYFNSDRTTTEYIRVILKHIIGNEAMSPLVVLEIFQKLNNCGYSIMKDIMNEYLAKLQRIQYEDKKYMTENYKKIDKLNGDINDLSRKSKLFNMIKCSFCSQQLYMPVTYFFCGHAFHPHCLNTEIRDDMQKECPTCFKKIVSVLQRLKQSEEKIHDHNAFFTDLHGKKKKNDLIAQYLGKGVFNLNDVKSEQRQLLI